MPFPIVAIPALVSAAVSLYSALKGSPQAKKSGSLPNQAILGEEFSQYLLQQLRTPVDETESFRVGSTAIRDMLSRQAGASRDRLGDVANTRGFLDSGETLESMTDIDRAEMQAFGTSLNNLILGLEDRKSRGALGYLGLGVNENTRIEGINVGSTLAKSGQNMQFASNFLGGNNSAYDKLTHVIGLLQEQAGSGKAPQKSSSGSQGTGLFSTEFPWDV